MFFNAENMDLKQDYFGNGEKKGKNDSMDVEMDEMNDY
jgi:hypothetical protein